jgi:hypothetical protein
MSGSDQSLKKLKMTPYLLDKGGALKNLAGPFEVLYNPESLTIGYGATFREESLADSSNTRVKFGAVTPSTLAVELILDSSLPDSKTSVDEQLSSLYITFFRINGAVRTPNIVKVEWGNFGWAGQMKFTGWMTNMTVTCSLFDRSGAPQRANLSVQFLEELELDMGSKGGSGGNVSQGGGQGGSSGSTGQVSMLYEGGPVPDGATLAHIAEGAWSVPSQTTASDYLSYARENDLDSLEALTPGQFLRVPGSRGA